ncbi:MAG: hypothetical protein ACXWF8_00090 [Methylobacter sp.]
MDNYQQSKKARRIISVVYLLIMTVIMTGTYLSQKHKEEATQAMPNPATTTP